MRKIDADALIECLQTWRTAAVSEGLPINERCAVAMIAQVNLMPTIEERKKGKWIPQDHNKTNGMASTLVYYYPKCSVCGHCANYTNFCPNCGADMRKDGEKE